jgi:DNA-binding NarL/FixJ family response regulator
MKFQVEIPDDAFWKVAARAETFDMKVPEYAAELVISAAGSRAIPESDPLVVLWRSGESDRAIARRLNMTNSSVATRRRHYGLPANRQPRGALHA